jgi:23S rRNA pseudouridine2605 synthase
MTTPKKAPKKTAKKSTSTEPKPKKVTKAKKTIAAEPEVAAVEAVAPEATMEIAPEAPAAKKRAAKKLKNKPDASEPVAELSAPEQLETSASEVAEAEEESESVPTPRPPAKLERLQKILAAAGVASRRSAEGMIEQGRVQVNGKVVTTPGTKADAGRDHIRVDGKLLQGPERLRYFVLNKPRGFVTTVTDPEGRPTVMQFFEKLKERLYPVGRLDYLSEGLLVVTNDGELANKLTKASSGVEKTYLVKVAGQPTEAELDVLRGGVSIALGAPGSRQVRTSPARIRQVRQGDNPWYEVVLIEGRNRELRKMFEQVGHFVEKIRRTGYGPLVLDQEPGNLRELQPEELEALRKAADGTLRTPKSKDLRRRNLLDAGLLPTVLPKPSARPRPPAPIAPPPVAARPIAPRPAGARPGGFGPKKFGANRPARPSRPADSFASGEGNKFFRSARPNGESFRPAAGRTSAPNPVRSFSRSEEERPARSDNGAPANFGFNRPAGRSFDRPDARRDSTSAARPAPRGPKRPFDRPAGRPTWKKDDRPARPPARFVEGTTGADRPSPARPSFERPRPDSARPFAAKPAWKKPGRPEGSGRPDRPARPEFNRSAAPRREAPARNARVFDEDLGPVRPPNLHIEEITGQDRQSTPRPGPRPGAPRSSYRPNTSRPTTNRPASGGPGGAARPFSGPFSGGPKPGRPSFSRPARPEGSRPSTTSSGKPRAGGARPSSKPGRPGWKPKPSFGSAKPGFKARPGGKFGAKKRRD